MKRGQDHVQRSVLAQDGAAKRNLSDDLHDHRLGCDDDHDRLRGGRRVRRRQQRLRVVATLLVLAALLLPTLAEVGTALAQSCREVLAPAYPNAQIVTLEAGEVIYAHYAEDTYLWPVWEPFPPLPGGILVPQDGMEIQQTEVYYLFHDPGTITEPVAQYADDWNCSTLDTCAAQIGQTIDAVTADLFEMLNCTAAIIFGEPRCTNYDGGSSGFGQPAGIRICNPNPPTPTPTPTALPPPPGCYLWSIPANSDWTHVFTERSVVHSYPTPYTIQYLNQYGGYEDTWSWLTTWDQAINPIIVEPNRLEMFHRYYGPDQPGAGITTPDSKLLVCPVAEGTPTATPTVTPTPGVDLGPGDSRIFVYENWDVVGFQCYSYEGRHVFMSYSLDGQEYTDVNWCDKRPWKRFRLDGDPVWFRLENRHSTESRSFPIDVQTHNDKIIDILLDHQSEYYVLPMQHVYFNILNPSVYSAQCSGSIEDAGDVRLYVNGVLASDSGICDKKSTASGLSAEELSVYGSTGQWTTTRNHAIVTLWQSAQTSTPAPATRTPPPTFTPQASRTPTNTPTATITPTITPTWNPLTPTPTPTATGTATATGTPYATSTPRPTSPPTPTPDPRFDCDICLKLTQIIAKLEIQISLQQTAVALLKTPVVVNVPTDDPRYEQTQVALLETIAAGGTASTATSASTATNTPTASRTPTATPALPRVRAEVSKPGAVREGAGFVAVNLVLSQPHDKSVSVHWETQAGSAVGVLDYVPWSEDITFAPGETVKTVQIIILDDDEGESDESFSVVLSSPDNALLDDFSSAMIQIQDDDRPATPTASNTPTGTLTATSTPAGLPPSDLVCRPTATLQPMNKSPMPDLALVLPTIRPLPTLFATIEISAHVMIDVVQTAQSAIETPMRALETSTANYDWEGGELLSQTAVANVEPGMEWVVLLNPNAPAWTEEGSVLWALAPFLGPLMPIISISLLVVIAQFFLWVLKWLLRLLDIIFGAIELIPGE